MPPTLEGMLAAATGASGFKVDTRDGVDVVTVTYPDECKVGICDRLTWQGGYREAIEIIRRVQSGDLGEARHGARLDGTGPEWVSLSVNVD